MERSITCKKKDGTARIEFCGLTESDMDFENRTINVDHQLQYSGKKAYRIETLKTENSDERPRT